VGLATAFVERSASEASVLVADEVYEQHVKRDLPARDVLFFDRAMRSTVAWVRLPAVDDIWVPFRDVLEVDGVRVDDWDHRLEAALAGSSESAVTDAAAIDALGWRFQIGSLSRRTTNAMLPLAFLLTTYRDRFVFRSRGAEAVDGVPAVRVDYTEQATPTLAWAPRGSARAVRSQGSFWIAPGTGRVLKATLIWTEGLFLTSDFTITYQPVGSSGIAPAVLQERYRTLSDVAAPGMLFEMTSRYTNVRAAGSPAR